MAAHGTDAYAEALYANGLWMIAMMCEDLVALGIPLPLLARHTILEIAIDPRDEAAGERDLELIAWELGGPHGSRDRSSISKIAECGSANRFATDWFMAPPWVSSSRILAARPLMRLDSHGRNPLDKVLAEETVESHHHKATVHFPQRRS